MWPVSLWLVALLVIAFTHWMYKWSHPKCNGKLPPGSMGFPLIGETIQFFIPSKSLGIPPFIKKRVRKYGSVFRTSLIGSPVVVSADPDFNHFILQQEGKLVELWYLDSFAKLFDATCTKDLSLYIHKYLRNTVLNHIGVETLKRKLVPELEKMGRHALHTWTSQPSVEVKHATSMMIFDFTWKLLVGFENEELGRNIAQDFTNFLKGFISFPLNIPGTAFYRCLKNKNKAIKMIKEIMEERRASPEKRRGDFLDQMMDGMKTETFLTDNFISVATFGILLASFEAISTALTLAINLLTDHPLVVQELMKENEEILRNRENKDTGMTWKEYKSMTFTMQVINELLRMTTVLPGILRRAIKDIHVNGYTIPQGWIVMVVPSAIHFNSNTYEDPLTFNPWRWKESSAAFGSKNFSPFGGGLRSCMGAELSKLSIAVFLHVLVTNYKWIKVKGGEIYGAPALGFGNGFHIKVSEKLK